MFSPMEIERINARFAKFLERQPSANFARLCEKVLAGISEQEGARRQLKSLAIDKRHRRQSNKRKHEAKQWARNMVEAFGSERKAKEAIIATREVHCEMLSRGIFLK